MTPTPAANCPAGEKNDWPIFRWASIFHCGADSNGRGLVLNKAEKFALYTPTGFNVTKSSPVEDFEIYTVEEKGRPYLSIYLGNHPSFSAPGTCGGEPRVYEKVR